MESDKSIKNLKDTHEELRKIKRFFKNCSRLTKEYKNSIELEVNTLKLKENSLFSPFVMFEFKKVIDLRLVEYSNLSKTFSECHLKLKELGEIIKNCEAKAKINNIITKELAKKSDNKKSLDIKECIDQIIESSISQIIIFSKSFLQLNDYKNKNNHFSIFEKNISQLITNKKVDNQNKEKQMEKAEKVQKDKIDKKKEEDKDKFQNQSKIITKEKELINEKQEGISYNKKSFNYPNPEEIEKNMVVLDEDSSIIK